MSKGNLSVFAANKTNYNDGINKREDFITRRWSAYRLEKFVGLRSFTDADSYNDMRSNGFAYPLDEHNHIEARNKKDKK